MPRRTDPSSYGAPRFSPPADTSRYFGSHSQEARRLMDAASAADWAGDRARADRLRDDAAYHRTEAATHGDCMPLF